MLIKEHLRLAAKAETRVFALGTSRHQFIKRLRFMATAVAICCCRSFAQTSQVVTGECPRPELLALRALRIEKSFLLFPLV